MFHQAFGNTIHGLLEDMLKVHNNNNQKSQDQVNRGQLSSTLSQYTTHNGCARVKTYDYCQNSREFKKIHEIPDFFEHQFPYYEIEAENILDLEHKAKKICNLISKERKNLKKMFPTETLEAYPHISEALLYTMSDQDITDHEDLSMEKLFKEA